MARFKKGVSGNPSGRPRGASDRRRQLHLAIRRDGAALVKKAAQLALGGDQKMLVFLLTQLLPRDVPVEIGSFSGNMVRDGGKVLRELGAGRLTPSEASTILGAILSQTRLVESEELKARIAVLEKKVEEKEKKV